MKYLEAALAAAFVVFPAFAGTERSAEVDSYKQSTERQIEAWNNKIDLLKEKADAAKPGDNKLHTAVRDLLSHRDRVRDELKRVSDDPKEVSQTENAKAAIDRHLRQMDQLYSANRNVETGQTRVQ